MGSITVVTYPMVAALKAAERIMGSGLKWNTVNPQQERFLRDFFSVCSGEIDQIPEIESIASWSADEINEFLRKCGFSIQLEPFNPQTFGTASVLDLLVEWIEKGTDADLKTEDKKEFPGVYIKEKNVHFYRVPDHPNPIACLITKSNDLVYMTMWDEPHVPEGFDLVMKAEIFSSTKKSCDEFGELHFPMVDLDQKVDISWLKGMNTIGQDGIPGKIVQALQQTKLRMNEIGASVQSAVAFGVLRGVTMSKPTHTIDRPFLIWFEREGLNKPFFVGYIDREDWKRPAKL